MSKSTSDIERYPIGTFQPADSYSQDEIAGFLTRLEKLPTQLADAIIGLTDSQLDTPYREGGWTIRQVVHHVADSHMNAFIRIKWTLTENTPVIKAYDEKAWAETPETKLSVAFSLQLIQALHAKFVALALHIPHHQLTKRFVHPATKREISIGQLLATYAWHGDHHLAHITSLKTKKGW